MILSLTLHFLVGAVVGNIVALFSMRIYEAYQLRRERRKKTIVTVCPSCWRETVWPRRLDGK